MNKSQQPQPGEIWEFGSPLYNNVAKFFVTEIGPKVNGYPSLRIKGIIKHSSGEVVVDDYRTWDPDFSIFKKRFRDF